MWGHTSEHLRQDDKWNIRSRVAPLPPHHEAREGEIYLEYATREWFDNVVKWRTKQIGKVAYTRDGHIVPGKFPVFVQAKELSDGGML